MFLSKLGYSELVQRLFEKMTFSLMHPLSAVAAAAATTAPTAVEAVADVAATVISLLLGSMTVISVFGVHNNDLAIHKSVLIGKTQSVWQSKHKVIWQCTQMYFVCWARLSNIFLEGH